MKIGHEHVIRGYLRLTEPEGEVGRIQHRLASDALDLMVEEQAEVFGLLKDLVEQVEMAESVGGRIEDRVPCLRALEYVARHA